jgi:ECF sigma factor
VASQIMRRILVDRARAGKRSGQWARVTRDNVKAVTHPVDVHVLDFDAALPQLAEFDPRKSQIAELRFLPACRWRLSLATVERDWQAARAWLFGALSVGTNRDG